MEDSSQRDASQKSSKWIPPPSSVEEAAALLGASITRLNNELVYRTTAPPHGLHSSFSTVKPVPCSELYVRLSSLANILTSHLKPKDAKIENENDTKNENPITIEAAPSIIPLLHKLFTISSSLALTPIYLHSSNSTIPPFNPLASIAAVTSNSAAANDAAVSTGMNTKSTKIRSDVSAGQSAVVGGSLSSTTTSNSSVSKTSSNTNGGLGNSERVNRNLQVPPKLITPPLCSKPIRHLWIKCITLAHRLSPTHALPSTNPQVLLGLYFNAAGGHPKSAKSAGGCRVAALGLLQEIFQDDQLGKRYIRALLPQIISLCHNGLRSSGANDFTHRVQSIQCARAALMAWRDTSPPIFSSRKSSRHFLSDNLIDDRVLQECVKLLRKGAEDKYPEVRLASAEFACVFSSMSIAEEQRSGNNRRDYNLLQFLDDTLSICVKNVDDESIGVGCKWSEALARGICSALEYHEEKIEKNPNYITDVTGKDSNGNKSGGVSGGSGKNDLTTKLKAFNEHRKAMSSIGSISCVTLDFAMTFLVQLFARVKGDGAARMGGSYSMGGKYVRVGVSLVLVHLCRLQLEIGGIRTSSVEDCLNPGDAIQIIMKMVGSRFSVEPDIVQSSSEVISPSLSDIDDSITMDATTSPPRRKNLADKASSVGGFLRNMGGNIPNHPCDASLARMATCRVLRKGLLDNMSETMQFSVLREMIASMQPRAHNLTFNRHQMQVALIEISSLVTTLGEATASTLDELLPILECCLTDADHGVRHEAAVAYQAIVTVFPSVGRKYIMTSIGQIQIHQDEILALCASGNDHPSKSVSTSLDTPPPKRRNRRRQAHESSQTIATNVHKSIGKSLDHQYAIHGNALVLSMILHALPKLPGGLPSELLDIIIAVADNLVSCQGNTNLIESNPGALITCVRSGYNIISGALTVGKKATIPHLQKIFRIWSRSTALVDEEKNRLGSSQTLSVLEPFVTSILVFLRCNSELLLDVPDALNHITCVLERLFPIILGYSQLETDDTKSFASSRLDSAKATIMETFSWLPTGSFPLISNSVFSFASRQIQMETKSGICSSALDHLLASEDDILDARSISRTKRFGQVGHGCVEESILAVNSKCIGLSEREAVLHLLVNEYERGDYDNSPSMQNFCHRPAFRVDSAPTPLHKVGKWLPPPVPSRSSKERLINSAIHIFASTFALQDGHQQSIAIKMLEDLMKSKVGQTENCPRNVSASILASLRAMPTNITSDESITQSASPWIPQAAQVLLSILPVSDGQVRRAAAESLGILASLGISKNSSTLQNSILSKLEDLMSIDVSDISTQQKPQVPISTSNVAGCLLAFGSLQREAVSRMSDERRTSHAVDKSTPTTVMMMKLLPYVATQSAEGDSFVSRTFALHSFGLILAYSEAIDGKSMGKDERNHILSKAIEVVESNFYAAWMTNSTEADIRILEAERMAVEPSFLAVLVRIMTYLVPRLQFLEQDDPSVASRFSSMVSLILNLSHYHSSVVLEGILFFNCVSLHKELLQPKSLSINGTGSPPRFIAPILMNAMKAQRISILNTEASTLFSGCRESKMCLRATTASMRVMIATSADELLQNAGDFGAICNVFTLLQQSLGSRQSCFSHNYRSFATPSNYDRIERSSHSLFFEIRSLFISFLLISTKNPPCCSKMEDSLLHWINFLKEILNGGDELHINCRVEGDSHVYTSLQCLLKAVKMKDPLRWQMRCEITKLLSMAVDTIAIIPSNDTESLLVPYAGDLVSIACSIALATFDQSELYSLQNIGLRMLHNLINYLADTIDPNEEKSMLLEEYTSQILPCIKHALNYSMEDSEDSVDNEGARNLFLSGCECLLLLAKHRLIPDVSSFKRLLKTIIPSKEMLYSTSYPNNKSDAVSALHIKPKSFVDNRTSILLPRVGALWAIAGMYMSGEIGSFQEKLFATLKQEISHTEGEIAINCAALAIDSCRLKGIYPPGSDTGEVPHEYKSALTFQNLKNVDDATKEALMDSCPTMACFSLLLLMKNLSEANENCEKNLILKSWVPIVLRVVLVEFYESVHIIEGMDDHHTSIESALEACAHCLLVLRYFIEDAGIVLSIDEAQNVTRCVFKILHLSIPKFVEEASTDNLEEFQGDSSNSNSLLGSSDAITLLSQACTFVECACRSNGLKEKAGTEFLIREVLSLLVVVGKSEGLSLNMKLVNTSILSSYYLIQDDGMTADFVKGLLGFTLSMLGDIDKFDSDAMKNSVYELIQFCLSSTFVSQAETIFCVRKMAECGNWDAWQLCVDGNISALYPSLIHIGQALVDETDSSRHADVLIAIVTVAKNHQYLLPRIVSSIGAQVLNLFKSYGSTYNQQKGSLDKNKRSLVCANCMKFVMLTYQFMVSEADSHDEQIFLAIVFDVLSTIVLYNGLPNQATTNADADPALGRMCAQFFVHVLRTSPVTFKACMGNLSERSRASLETSVRAEMSGYIRNEPTRKKLNIKSFRR